MKKSFVSKYIKNKYTIAIVVIAVVVVYFVFFYGVDAKKYDFAIAKIGDITERVSVTGKISPIEKADLAFEKSGKITSIKVKVGDRVKKGDLLGTLDSTGDRANLNSALAKLADLSRGLNAPELAFEQAKINTASVTLKNAKQDALNATKSALVVTQTAINNYADVFFDNPQSVNPNINIRTSTGAIQTSINYDRLRVTEIMNQWKVEVDKTNSVDNISDLIVKVNTYESTIKAFMDKLFGIVNDLNSSNSGLARTTIDSHISTMITGLSKLNQAVDSVALTKSSLENAVANYDQIYNNYSLKNSGSSVEAVQSQRAIVESYKAELEKNTLISPIDGIVTKIESEIGEFVSPGTLAFSVISDGDYKIEAYIPEADIAKVSLSDMASTTLDAYGQYIDFPALVMSVDPAETILEGVPTYRIVLQFVYKDDRIKSGMTANIDILTNEKKDVLTVPTRAVQTDDDGKFLRIVNEDEKDFTIVPVKVGLKGSNGMIEIISGINVGDKVVTYIK